MVELVEFGFEFRNRRFRDAEAGLTALAQTLEQGTRRLGPVLGREMRTYLEGVAGALAKRHGSPWPGGTGTRTLARRSGRALRSIQGSVEVTGRELDDIQGALGGVFYLRTHEFGATIKARRAKWLTIPLPAALKADGTPIKRSARDWANTFVARSRQGNLLIFQRRGAGIVPLYALKREVQIPPRLGLRETLEAGLPYFVDRVFGQMLNELVEA